jgi:hypothetical protein
MRGKKIARGVFGQPQTLELRLVLSHTPLEVTSEANPTAEVNTAEVNTVAHATLIQSCQSPDLPQDVDQNGLVTVSDLLTIVAFIRENGTGLSATGGLDVDGNSMVTINDALWVSTHLRFPHMNTVSCPSPTEAEFDAWASEMDAELKRQTEHFQDILDRSKGDLIPLEGPQLPSASTTSPVNFDDLTDEELAAAGLARVPHNNWNTGLVLRPQIEFPDSSDPEFQHQLDNLASVIAEVAKDREFRDQELIDSLTDEVTDYESQMMQSRL